MLKQVILIPFIANVILLSCSGPTPSAFSDTEEKLQQQLKDTLDYFYKGNVITVDKYNEIVQHYIDTAYDDTTDAQSIAYFQYVVDEMLQDKKDRNASKAENEKKKEQLIKSKFNVKIDEFNDAEYYTPKSYGKYYQNVKTLTAGVNNTGFVWVRSNYHSKSWLFHESIAVLIGDDKYTSHTVKRNSENYITEIDGGNIWEIITYENDKAIIEAIAKNVNETIKVRFNGQKKYDDIVLSQKYKQAIADCYNLAMLIDATQ